MKMHRNIIILIVMTVILVSISATMYIKFWNDLAAGHARICNLRTHVYHSRYGAVEYLLQGKGPTILISHGITGGVDQGIELADRYAGKGYRFLYISRFGYLRSAMPDEPSAKLQAKVYNDLLDFLHLERLFIMGNSAGGPSAIHFAVDYPEKCSGIILVSSAVLGNTKALPPKPFMRAVFGSDFLYWCTVTLFGTRMVSMFVPGSIWETLPPQEKETLLDNVFLSVLPVSMRTGGILFDTYVSNPSIDGKINFERITSPALIIHAVDDPAPPVEGARLLSKRIPKCEFVSYETGGHLILDHEDDIRRTISRFIFR